MRTKLEQTRNLMLKAALFTAFFLAFTAAWAADNEEVLFNFQGGAYGDGPGQIVRDSAGNFYGTLEDGGDKTCSGGCGMIFELTPNASGQLIETILHSFTGDSDGAYPTDILMDSKGDLFVSTFGGGLTGCANGCGAVVELSPLKAGGWSTTVLHDFPGGVGGYTPYLTVIDSKGNLYGYATGGPDGQIFELSPVSLGGLDPQNNPHLQRGE